MTEILTSVFAFLSAIVAVFAIYLPWRMQQNSELLNQAVLSLERAYLAITENNKPLKPVSPNRLNWLTCARHIESYKLIKSKISTDLHKLLCNEHEEYWRHQFYQCLNMHNITDPGYYDKNPDLGLQLGIEPTSAIIIYSFASWPRSKTDVIKSVDTRKLIDEFDPLKGNIGLEKYLEKFPKIFEGKNKSRRTS